MSSASELKFDIGHVLFIDIVGYSKLLIAEQSNQIQTLREIVRGTEQFKKAEAEGKLLRLPTGDGGALVFRNSLEAPVLCALEISKALKSHSELKVRMGIHSGPVNEITDLNEQANIAGVGINMAQRVMDCGDAGHILLSKRVADDLEQYPQWRSHLSDLGECEVKHGARVSVVNLYTDDAGNRAAPQKFRPVEAIVPAAGHRAKGKHFVAAALILTALIIVAGAFWLLSRQKGGPPVPTSTSSSTSIGAPVPDNSIAVLPLANESGEKDQYFSDGLSEDLITALTQLSGLKVIGRTSSFQFRDSKDDSKTIGEKLGVSHLLQGSVRRAGDAVRISAELIKAVDGSTLWSQHYDRPYKDLFKLQDDITTAVADALKTKLLNASPAAAQSDRPPSGSLPAYNAFLEGQFHSQRNTQDDFRAAIDSYQTAVSLDPHYARAYASMGYAQTFYGDYFAGAQAQQIFAMARTSINTALTLNPNLAGAHGAHALLLAFADLDFAGAKTEFERAVQLAPNDLNLVASLAQMRAAFGYPEAAVEPIRQSLVTDPRNAGWYGLLAADLIATGRLDEAEQATREQIALESTAQGPKGRLCTIEVLRGNAAAALEKAEEIAPGKSRDLALARARQIGNDPTAASAALKTLIDRYADTNAFFIAGVYALRKDPEKMFEWLDRAWANRDNNISILYYDPYLLRYKDDPRFATFCRKIGLPTPAEVAAGSKS
ncbi:MAG: adenylate/guanylate cyclase domain-containing protein [Candidatus Udaeobacter sp.]